MAGLTSQMEGLGVAGAAALDTAAAAGIRAAHHHRKKPHRHAYHDIGASHTASSPALQPGDTQAYGGGVPSSPSVSPVPVQQRPAVGGGRVDPEQIPSVPRSRDIPATYYFEHVYPTMERHLPPPAAIPFVAYDQGNSSPKFARLTLNNIPSTADFLSSTALPLGMVLQPLARLDAGEQPVPVLDFGNAGPPRCHRCRTYINPFMIFRSGGNKFICNMCTFPNDVPPEYFMPLEPSGARVDRLQRPELMMGTVEFLVPKEYWNKEPVGLNQLILIDVSAESVRRGVVGGVCKGIMDALYGETQEGAEEGEGAAMPIRKVAEGSKIGIVTFDKEVQFYNLNVSIIGGLCFIFFFLQFAQAQLDQAQMVVMNDLEEPFVPFIEGLFVDPYESKDIISSLLGAIPKIFSRVKNPEAVALPALNAALSALQPTGGKVVCCLAGLPTWGPGMLHMREDPKIHGTEMENKLFTTEHPAWKKMATKFADAGIGVDMFLAAPGGAYTDVATLGYASEVTGGEIFFYPNFHAPRDILKFSSELAHTLTRETGYQSLMKVRCSNGLQVSSYHGNFLHHTFGADLEIGSIDEDKALGVLFSYDGKLDTRLDAHFQAALLYTSADGQRRVRCINIVAAVNDGGLETMKFVDQDAIVNIIAKEGTCVSP